jgi:molybdopterin synthase catalytic subunit
MRIQVLYFAVARGATGVASEAVVVDSPATVGGLRDRLTLAHPALARVLPRCRIAVDRELAEDGAPLREGAEVAILPPVSGGLPRVAILDGPLALSDAIAAVASPARGGVVTFTGTVRGETGGRRVVRLEYEAYVPMAEAKLAEIAAALEAEHGAAVAILHRVGVLAPGDAAVVIACAAPHRTAAFRACEAAIERLKREVPIWKREVFEDGSEWVGAGP